MKLTVLVDNCCRIDKYLLAEPALSFFIEINNKKILFDTGYSDILLKNAFKLKLDVRQVTEIIFSHRHNDHTGGLYFIRKLYQDSRELGIDYNPPTIVAHPSIFEPQFEPQIGNIGIPFSKDHLTDLFNINLSQKPIWIDDKLCFLGEIPRLDSNKDCIDDTALVYKSKQGLVVITGCSHAGLKNIMEYAKNVMNEKIFSCIIGGFHLLDKTEKEMNELIDYLKTQNIGRVLPCHCCDIKSKIMLAKALPMGEVCVGDVYEFI